MSNGHNPSILMVAIKLGLVALVELNEAFIEEHDYGGYADLKAMVDSVIDMYSKLISMEDGRQ